MWRVWHTGSGGGAANNRSGRACGRASRIPEVASRYRCASCGNLTRFDVTTRRRTRAFHHYTLGGELDVEEEQVLEEVVEEVTCRWCGPSGTVEALGEEA